MHEVGLRQVTKPKTSLLDPPLRAGMTRPRDRHFVSGQASRPPPMAAPGQWATPPEPLGRLSLPQCGLNGLHRFPLDLLSNLEKGRNAQTALNAF